MFGRDKDTMDVIETLPMVPLRDLVIFPHAMIPFVVGRPSSIKALEYGLVKGKKIFVSAQHDATRDNPGPDEIYTLGTICNIVQSLKLPDGNLKVLVEGLDRGRALEFKEEGGFLKVVAKLIPRQVETGSGIEAVMSKVIAHFEQYVKLSNNLHYDAMLAAVRVEDPGKLADTIASHLVVSVEEKQNLLEIFSPQDRLTRIGAILEAEVDKLQVDKRIQGRVKKQMERAQKEYYLNEKMKAIQKELGRKDDRGNENEELRKKIEQARMPKDAEEKAVQELKRLESMPPMSAEATVSRNYLDWLIAMPWAKKTRERKDLLGAEKILNEDHSRAREGQGAHRRVPGRAPARQQPQGADPLLRRARRAWARPRWPSPSPAPRTASSSASRSAGSATRRRSAATGAPTSAPSPARSSR